MFTNSSFNNSQDKTNADTYWNQVVHDAENFEQAMHMWMAGESESEVEEINVITKPKTRH